jgi:hypothetical protein
VWTEIDRKAPWLNTASNKEATPGEKSKIAIPDALKPNFKPFYFAFSIDKHVLLFEATNELSHSFGPTRAKKFFASLFDIVSAESGADYVEVTSLPEDGTVEKILSMDSLRRLKIVLLRPNPDDLYDDAERVLKKLSDEKAKCMTVELIRAPKASSLEPDADTRTLAIVASTNGYVEGDGKDVAGTNHFESTKEHPKRISYVLGPDQSSEVQFISRLDSFSAVAQPPSAPLAEPEGGI